MLSDDHAWFISEWYENISITQMSLICFKIHLYHSRDFLISFTLIKDEKTERKKNRNEKNCHGMMDRKRGNYVHWKSSSIVMIIQLSKFSSKKKNSWMKQRNKYPIQNCLGIKSFFFVPFVMFVSFFFAPTGNLKYPH